MSVLVSRVLLRRWSWALLIGALLGLAATLAAEDLRFDRISVEDGLAHTSVWDVAQDSRGFVWIATESYLQRYDGYELKAYKHDPEDPESLSASEVTAIYEDRRGNLWFGTRGAGLNRLDRAEERFVHYGADPYVTPKGGKRNVPGGLLTALIWSLQEDREGALWVGTATACTASIPIPES